MFCVLRSSVSLLCVFVSDFYIGSRVSAWVLDTGTQAAYHPISMSSLARAKEKRIRTNRQIPPAAKEYADEVRRKLGRHVQRIVLFGSHARGDATAASDYDFAVVVDVATRSGRDAVTEAGVRLLNERNALCAALMYDPEQWTRMLQTPLGGMLSVKGFRCERQPGDA